MSNTMSHAKRELALLGYKPVEELEDGDINKTVQQNILELLEVFGKQGHSNTSAQYVISMFFKLASFEPITPLTGEDSEWEKIDFQTFQNTRCSRVFKNLNTGAIYDIQGKIFVNPDGSRFANNNSIVDITFPYTPNTVVVKVPAPEPPPQEEVVE